MSTLSPQAIAKRNRAHGIIFAVAGVLFVLLGLVSAIWPFAILGLLLALAGAYGVRRGAKLQREL